MSTDLLQLQNAMPQAPATAPSAKSVAGARKAAQDFEAVLVNELLSHMDQGLSTEGPFTGGQSEGVYRSFFDDAVAKEIVKRGGIGVAENVFREILKLQEAKDGAAPAPIPVSATGAAMPARTSDEESTLMSRPAAKGFAPKETAP